MSTFEDEAVVELTIPGVAEFVGVARLAVLGVASRMRFSYDEVEDIRLAVGEACATAIERANGAGRRAEVRVRCLIAPSKLVVEVCDVSAASGADGSAAPGGDGATAPAAAPSGEEPSLGGILIRILMDDVHTVFEDGRRVVRMVKYISPPGEAGS